MGFHELAARGILPVPAEVIDAKKALEVGLVNEVVPREQLDARVEAIARHIAQAPLTTLLATKANLKRAWELMGMRVHWQSSNDLVALASISKDVQQLISDGVQGQGPAVRAGPSPGRGGRIDRRRSHLASRGPLVNIADHAISAADSPALIMADGAAISFGELYARSRRVAAVLHDAGLRRGDGVALILPNRPRILRNHLGLPAFRALLHRCQHPLHSRRSRLRHRRLRRQGGVRRRVDGRSRRPRPRRERGGATSTSRSGAASRLGVLRRCPGGGGRGAAVGRRVRDALFVGHHGTAQGRPPAAPHRRQRLLGAGGAGDGADSPLQDVPGQRVPVPRAACITPPA